MDVSIAVLQKDSLVNIFSYLDIEGLGAVAQVCKFWKEAREVDSLWRKFCVSVFDLHEPLQGSWEKQCQSICRWKTGKYERSSMAGRSLTFRFIDSAHSLSRLSLLEDNTAFEVVLEKDEGSSGGVFSVRDLKGRELRKITLGQQRYEIGEFALNGTTLTVVTQPPMCNGTNRGIFQFDIRTGNCLGSASVEFEQSTIQCLYVSGHEVVMAVGNNVQIWDPQQHRVIQAFQVPELHAIGHICSTQNYILCIDTESWPTNFILAINKKDPLKRIRVHEERQDFTCPQASSIIVGSTMTSSGGYCSFFTADENLHIYKEAPDDVSFRRVRTIDGFSSLSKTARMYRNWVCVNKNKEIQIFDIRTGEQIAHLEKQDWTADTDFRINTQMLILRNKNTSRVDGMFTEKTVHTVYNFGRGV